MFASFKGQISNIHNDKVTLEINGGVGYLITCSARTLKALQIGQAAFLLVETVVREDQISIYGFIDNLEQSWFNLLTTVKGIGPRMALQILGQIDMELLAQEIMAQSKAIFKGISGVGNKIADRIIVELKDKPLPQAEFQPNSEANIKKFNQHYEDAILALTSLGYQRNEALKTVNNIYQADNDNNLVAREIIKLALKELSK